MLATVLMSFAMAVLTVAAAWVPFFIPSTFDLTRLSQFSAGVILGTSFALVLPECYEAFEGPTIPGVLIVAGFLLMTGLQVFFGQDEGDTSNTSTVELRNPVSWFRGISMSALGMTIHAAADGIALGVTNGSSQAIVFIAIILHKVPAAFGLTALLLSQKKHSTNHIKRDVVLFSLAGPILAVLLAGITWVLQAGAKDPEHPGLFATSCLALSGGTFVYVAMHVLEDLKEDESQTLAPIGVVGAGALLPVLASFLHD